MDPRAVDILLKLDIVAAVDILFVFCCFDCFYMCNLELDVKARTAVQHLDLKIILDKMNISAQQPLEIF
jgi:hypothetical protein